MSLLYAQTPQTLY